MYAGNYMLGYTVTLGDEERSWKRKWTWKHLTFWGAGNESIFHKTVAGKRLNFCGRGSTLKKETGIGSKLRSK